jgi:hypothetical protein
MSAELNVSEAVDHDVIGQLPPALREWMTRERFQLHRPDMFQHPARDPGFDTRYFPQHCRPFRLPCYWMQRKHLYVHGSDESGERLHFGAGAGDERILFPVHPSELEEFRAFLRAVDAIDASEHDRPLWAVPTSSTRTLLVWPDGAGHRAVFVKTSLHSRIFGDRRVTRTKVARAIGNGKVIRQASLPSEFRVLPEILGFSARKAPDSGALIRPVPPEIMDGSVRVAPLFSLLGGEEQGRVPLLLEMLEHTDQPPVEYVDELLCATFAPLWVTLALNHGLIVEAHGQDLLLALSPAGVPSGSFYYRDLEGLQVDWELRHGRFGSPPSLPDEWAWRETHATWGYRYCEFVWYKWRISLFDYLRLVLNEVETSLRQWHDQGRVRGPKCREGELTMLFSERLFAAVERQFNVSLGAPYDILAALNRFILALFKVRRALIQTNNR